MDKHTLKKFVILDKLYSLPQRPRMQYKRMLK